MTFRFLTAVAVAIGLSTVLVAGNVPPALLQALPNRSLPKAGAAQGINLNSYIYDPDVTGTAVRVSVRIGTQSSGNIDLALDDQQTPLTVANFLRYLNAGAYTNNFFHRSVPGFIIQNGGFYFPDTTHFALVPTFPAVKNEPGLSNVAGTIAMAKLGSDPNSATSQWFINLVDNSSNLDNQNGGFTVFGRVVGSGLTVANAIAAVPTYDYSSISSAWSNLPLTTNALALNNFVETSMAVIPALSFSASSGNTSLMTVSLSGNTLTLTPSTTNIGHTTITVTATDLDGAQFQTSFGADVTQGPSFVSNPVSTSVTAGQTATFTAVASGNPAATYQWQISTNGGAAWSNLTDGSGIAGSTTGTLSISNTTTNMSGNQFRVVATNSAGSTTSSAASLSFVQFTFTTNGDGSINITGYNATGGAVVIPSTINGLTVSSIGFEAFYGANLTSVSIPDSVTSIGVAAFVGCSSLTTITVGAGNPAFSSIGGVLYDHSQTAVIQYPGGNVGSSYTIPGSVTSIGSYAFFGSRLTNVTIPATVTSIGDFAFTTSKLASVIIPPSVTSIGNFTFASTALTNVTIPEGVTSIAASAFEQCANLTSVIIHGSVSVISTNAFQICNNLTSVTFEANAPSVASTIFNSDNNVTVFYMPGTSGWGSTFAGVPAVLLNPPSSAGSLQVSITPAGAVSGGNQWQVDGGFPQPNGATVVGLSAGSHTVSFSAISGWATPANLTVTVSANLTTTASGVYIQQSQFTSTTNNGSVTITGYAGPGGTVAIPSELNGLPVTAIGDGAHSIFASTNVTSVTIPSGVTSISDYAFFNSNLNSVTIPATVTTIGDAAFASCATLANVLIANGVTSIGDGVAGVGAFQNCGSLITIAIPASVTSIAASAFAGCTNLTSIYFIGNAPGTIGDNSSEFEGDTSATAFFVQGTTGWSSTFLGLSTSQWVPGSLQVSLAPTAVVTAGAQWQVDGGTWQNSGATVANLSLGSHDVSFNAVSGWVTPADQIVSINANSSTTANGTYLLAQKAAITTQPVNKTVAVGTTATFTVAASGTPAPTFQWQISSNGGSTWSNLTNGNGVSGSTTGALSISNTTTSLSADQFRCVATNLAGSATSNAATLTVFFNANAPVFSQQPANKTVTAGQTATFSVAASGTPAPTYLWQFSNNGGTSWSNLANGSGITGATSTTLSVAGTTVAMTGLQFQCVATNTSGAATSNAATLAVNQASAVVTLSNLSQAYTGSAKSATVTTTPAGLAFNITYNGSATAPTAVGSYAVVATVTAPNYVGSATGTLVINKSTATVTLSNLSQPYTGSAKGVTVTTIPASLAVSVTYNGTTAQPLNTGNYAAIVTVTDPNYTGSATGTLTITKAAQTITFGALAPAAVGDAPFALTANATSGLPVTYTSSAPTVASVTSNGTVTPFGIGATVITASQAGNPNYNAAASVVQILTVNKAPSFTTQPGNQTVNAVLNTSFTVVASGTPVPTYQWQRKPAGGSTFTNLANSGIYSGVTTATLTVIGTTVAMSGDQFQCVATNSAGSATSNPATLTVNKAPATVTLSNLTQVYTGTPRPITVTTGPASLAVNITYNGSSTPPTIPGSYPVQATVTEANHVGSASGTLVINKSTATVTLSNLAQTYNGSAKSVTVVTNPVGLSVNVTYNGSTTPPTNGGSYAVVATITDPFSSGTAASTLTIAKATQTITFGPLAVVKVGDSPFALTANATSGLPVTYTSSAPTVASVTSNGTVTIVGVGATVITAAQAGNTNYNAAASGVQILTVNKSPVFTTQPGNPTVNAVLNTSFTVVASGTPVPTYQWQRKPASGSTFTNLANSGIYSGVTTATLTVIGTTVAMSGDQFQCVATNSAGSATSNPATLAVNKAPATVTLSNLTQVYTGTPRSITATTNPASLAVNITYNGSATPPTIPGSYPVLATVTEANHVGSASGTLVINKSTATVTLSNLAQTYNGSAKSVTVVTNPVGLSFNVTYNGSTTPPTNGGSYAVVATITDPFSSGTAASTLTIAKATQTITFGPLAVVKVGDAPFALSANATSGLPVTYTSSAPTVASVTSNGTVTIVGVGATVITASQAGNPNYNAAASVVQILTVNKSPVFTTQPGNQTVNAVLNTSFTVVASGTPVPTYQWQRMPAGGSTFTNLTNTANYTGVTTATLTVIGTTVAMSGDQFQCVATNSAGSATSNPAMLTVNKAPATVTLSNLTQVYTGSPKIVTATTNPASLALNITYNGSSTAPTVVGTYPVVATVTEANHVGSATGNLVITKAVATVTLSNLAQTYNGTAKSVTVTTTPANLTVNVTYNGSTTLPVNAGNYPVVATVVDANYSGTITGTLVIAKATQKITFGALSSVPANNGNFGLTATADSGLTISYLSSSPAVASVSNGIVTPVAKGATVIFAMQAGNSNYLAAPTITQVLTVTAAVSNSGSSGTGTGPPGIFSPIPFLASPSITSSNTTITSDITSFIMSDTSSVAWVSGLDPTSTDPAPSPTAAELPAALLAAMNLAATSPADLLPVAAVESVDGVSRLTLQYRQSRNLVNASLVVQYSTDELNWLAVPLGDVTQLPDDDINTERWSASVVIPNDGPIYLRVLATQNK